MIAMIERRTKKINKRKIRANDIRMMAEIIRDEYTHFLKQHESEVLEGRLSEYDSGPKMSFKVITKDDVEYASDAMDLFKADGVLDRKVITGFSLNFFYTSITAGIHIAISDSRHTNRPSTIEVEGRDSTWVNGTFSKLSEAVDSWERQGSVWKDFRWPISVILGIFGGFTLGWLLTLPLEKASESSQATNTTLAIFVCISFIAFWVILYLFESYLSKLWPDIEIVPEPEHERKLDKKRGRFKYVMLGIVIPFLASVIANWLT